jgi:NitT/TauT family transport system ATP-binding protein
VALSAGAVPATGREAVPPSDGSFLRVVGLDKKFRRGSGRRHTILHVLDDISIGADRGQFVTVIGPSGCGKSTLLSCIAGLTPFDAGQIFVGDKEVRGPGPDRAVVFQQASLFPWLTVRTNIAYGLKIRRQLSAAEIKDRTDEAIRLVGLTPFASHYPHEVSGGMQQRTNLARALAVNPELFLMDEPFGALDALTKETLQDELASLAARLQRTTIFITHDIAEAVFLGDVVFVMSSGPGRIAARIPVPFERPRTRDLTTNPEFELLVADLRHRLRGQSVAAAARASDEPTNPPSTWRLKA